MLRLFCGVTYYENKNTSMMSHIRYLTPLYLKLFKIFFFFEKLKLFKIESIMYL